MVNKITNNQGFKMNKKIIFMILGVIFLSEILLQINELIGFVCYTLLITGVLLILTKSESLGDLEKLIVILMIFPMVRILELFLTLSFYWKTSLIYYLFLFLALYYFIKFKFEFKPHKNGVGLILLSVFLGALLGFLGNSVFNAFTFEKSILFITIIPIIVFAEELFFRGMVQELITKNYGLSYGILLTSFFYALASLGFGLATIPFFVFFSLILSVAYNITKNIWLIMIISVIVHVFMFVL